MADKKRTLPKIGGANIRNVDAMVAAGMLTKAEGDRAKKRAAVKRKKK